MSQEWAAFRYVAAFCQVEKGGGMPTSFWWVRRHHIMNPLDFLISRSICLSVWALHERLTLTTRTVCQHCWDIIIVLLAPFQYIALLAGNNLQSGLSSASSVASSALRLCYDRSLFNVASPEVWGRPVILFQSLWGTTVRILMVSSIFTKYPNSIRHLFWITTECIWEVIPSHFIYGKKAIWWSWYSLTLEGWRKIGDYIEDWCCEKSNRHLFCDVVANLKKLRFVSPSWCHKLCVSTW